MHQLQLLEKYDNVVIRGLIHLIPYNIGGALDFALIQTLENMRKERTTAFFDELASGNVTLKKELLESNDFLHAYFATTKYALNSRRREKIEMFARLLKSTATGSEKPDFDEYEDFLKILDELSYRELIALNILDEYSSRPRTEEQNDLQWTDLFWDEFEQRLQGELSLQKDQVSGFMNRIARTGCYEMLTGTYWDYPGGRGLLTPTYHKLKKFIEAGK